MEGNGYINCLVTIILKISFVQQKKETQTGLEQLKILIFG